MTAAKRSRLFRLRRKREEGRKLTGAELAELEQAERERSALQAERNAPNANANANANGERAFAPAFAPAFAAATQEAAPSAPGATLPETGPNPSPTMSDGPAAPSGAPPIDITADVLASEPVPDAPPKLEPSPRAQAIAAKVVNQLLSGAKMMEMAWGVNPFMGFEAEAKPELERAWAISLDEWGIAAKVSAALDDKDSAQIIAATSGVVCLGGGFFAGRTLKKRAEEHARVANAKPANGERPNANAANASSSPSSPPSSPAPSSPPPRPSSVSEHGLSIVQIRSRAPESKDGR